MKIATVEDMRTTIDGNTGGQRVTYYMQVGNSADELWFELPQGSTTDPASERSDSVIVAMLPLLVLNGYDCFQSHLPMSEELYYNLTYHVIPQLTLQSNSASRELEISAPLTTERFTGTGVAAGMSLGVDSFATLSEYSRRSQLANYRLSHLSYFNVGAHHGRDNELGRSELTTRQLYDGQRRRVRDFCQAYEYPLFELESNLSPFLRRVFGKSTFNRSHTYRNAAAALFLQKHINKYYYSSAFNLDLFSVSLNSDSALYEKWLLPLLSTENVRFYSANKAWTRMDKTKVVSELPESYEFLTVCLLGVDNCGVCMKCRKTLMALDVLGDRVLERYSSVFDLERYVSSSRHEWFGSIHSRMLVPGLPGQDVKDIYIEGLRNKFRYLPEFAPETEYEDEKVGIITSSVSPVVVEPHSEAAEISSHKRNRLVRCLGFHEGWYKVQRDHIVGFVEASTVRLLRSVPQKEGTVGTVIAPCSLKSLPTARSESVGKDLTQGSELQLLQRTNKWMFVRSQDGATGYIRRAMLDA